MYCYIQNPWPNTYCNLSCVISCQEALQHTYTSSPSICHHHTLLLHTLMFLVCFQLSSLFPYFLSFPVCMLKDCTFTSAFVPFLPFLSSALSPPALHKTSGSHSVENQNNMREQQSEREIEKGGEMNKGKKICWWKSNNM